MNGFGIGSDKPSMVTEKSVAKITLWLLAGVVGLSIVSVGSCEYRQRAFSNAFDRIKEGDSRTFVHESLGEPNERDVEICRPEQACKNRYLYYSFMRRWIVEFDHSDRVSFRVYHEGSF